MKRSVADLHTHTYLCKHGCGVPRDYAAAAEKCQLSALGFSEHFPWPENYDVDSRMSPQQWPLYCSLIEEARESSSLKLLAGVEFDFVPGRMAEVSNALAEFSFDYLIGSIHFVDGIPFDHPDCEEEWQSSEFALKIYDGYAEALAEFMQSCDFDIIGHFDLPKKFGAAAPDNSKFRLMLHDILKLAAKRNVALEINTAGLRKSACEVYPDMQIIRLARDAGVKLTFGSDAHAPDEVGRDFDYAVKLAQAAGYSEYAIFNRREIELQPL